MTPHVTPLGQVVVLIHLSTGMGTEERMACMPNMTEFHQTLYHPNYMRTNDVRAVTCPMCRRTDTFNQCSSILATELGRVHRG
jgi:hypothetical protein